LRCTRGVVFSIHIRSCLSSLGADAVNLSGSSDPIGGYRPSGDNDSADRVIGGDNMMSAGGSCSKVSEERERSPKKREISVKTVR